MIIENPDAFKSWLTSILEPLCDADPAALAKYVYALVKKDKPVSELRAGMLDQLDVFLQHETKPFVDMLFKSLETQEYLTPESGEVVQDGEKQPSPPPDPELEKVEPPVHATNGKLSMEERLERRSPPSGVTAPPLAPAPAAPPARHRVVVRNKPAHEQTLVKASLPLTELLEEPLDQLPRRRDRRGDGLRDGAGPDRRRRRSRSWERRAGAARRRPHRDNDHDRNYERRRPISRSPSPRGRYRNRSPPNNAERGASRSRSRSPAGIIRDRDRDRLQRVRSVDRDRASRDREHRERQSRERERDRSRSRSRSLSAGPEHHEYSKRRCRDFDEKGYCMRGDLCQWDHGLDPVVLEDACLSRALAMPPHPHPPHPPHPPVPEYNPLTPDIWTGAGGPFPAPYPPPHAAHVAHVPPHLPRELIPIPRVRHDVAGGLAPPMMPVAPRHAAHAGHVPHAAHGAPGKKNFDYARLGKGPARGGGGGAPASGSANCSLEVKKVPRGLNDISHLNNHFSRFGKIVNIQVCFGGDPEGALITFSSAAEANVAYKSTEAVLNNRFIKVFWHNPENKQENTAPNNNASKPAERAANQHPLSHNKVLVNRVQPTRAVRAACAAAQQRGHQDAEKAAAEPTKEAKKENASAPTNAPNAPAAPAAGGKAVMEMHKRAQALLETQIHQQLLLIKKLESGAVSGPARAALLEAIGSSQEGIEKLRAELLAYNKALRHATAQDETAARLSRLQLAQKKPKTREEAQKEILDAELDMFTKQQEGQDVTALAKRIAELRRNLAQQFPPHHPARRGHARGGRFSTSRVNRIGPAPAAKVFNNQVVDHRPRALLVSGFEPEELDSLVAHFAQYGEITGKEVNLSVPELTVQYAARSHAEQAAIRARHYNDRTLSITWVANNKPIGVVTAPVTPANPAAAATPAHVQNGDAMDESKDPQTPSVSSDLLLEEEEDDEPEDRSWRR